MSEALGNRQQCGFIELSVSGSLIREAQHEGAPKEKKQSYRRSRGCGGSHLTIKACIRASERSVFPQ